MRQQMRRRGEDEGYGLETQIVEQLAPQVVDRTTPPAPGAGGPVNTTMGGYGRAQRAMQEDGVGPEAQSGALAGLSALGGGPSFLRPDMSQGESRLALPGSWSNEQGLSQTDMLQPPGGGDASRDWRDTLKYGGGGPGQLAGGFRQDDYGGDLKARNSVKNTFGRIAGRYPNTPEGLKQLVNDPDFKRAFPNARLLEGGAGDKIDFGGVLSDFESGSPVGVVDVGQSFDPRNNTGGPWDWMPEESGGGAADPMMGGGGMTIDGLLGGDPMAAINEQIAGLTGGQDNQIQALIEQILSGQQV